jgi:aromatic ring-opening dioxygenase LigB subunit
VFISTPHGIADLNSFLFYLNDRGYGSGGTDNCNCPPCCYNISVALDFELSSKLVSRLKELTSNVSGISGFGEPGNGALPFPLAWGEVIPLYFSLGLTKLHQTTKVIILSQPDRRYNHSISMIDELLQLGTNIHDILENSNETVAVIISGDLAHTHLPNGPYGYSNASEPFDEACGKWASTLDGTYIINDAAMYVDKALSCGYTGFVMLQGMLSVRYPGYWIPHLYANYHPSYYGMMVASFLPVTDKCSLLSGACGA